MQTQNVGAIISLSKHGTHLRVNLYGNPGPFPFGPPGTMGKGQYLGIGRHLVLTLIEDQYLTGLLAFAADVPYTPSGDEIRWCGGVACQPDPFAAHGNTDLWFLIHCLFLRDVDQLLAGRTDLMVGALVNGINGRVSGRQYWLVEIPALTREVLLNLDEIIVVRRRHVYRPEEYLRSKVVRGEFWQGGGLRPHPIYAERKSPIYAERKKKIGIDYSTEAEDAS